MLANVLAVLLGIGSFIFYLAAFFYPEVHRRSDFLWSGLGMFYAVVLWFCAEQMTPAILLGQLTSVILLMGLGWQTLTVRRQKTPVYQQTPVVLTPEVVGDWAKSKLNQLRIAPKETIRPQLQNRTLSAATTERLRQNLDPRRRPTYDYEFVEDGIMQAAPETSPVAVGLSESKPLSPSEDSGTSPLVAPPSVEAEVLQAIPAPPIAETPSADPISSDSEPADTIQVGTTTEPEISSSENEPSEEWGDLFEPDSNLESPAISTSEAESVPDPMSPPARQQPSLLATPLILLGWIKDVAASLTKPKPSKPVIDIPPRVATTTKNSIENSIEEEPSEPIPDSPDAASEEEVPDAAVDRVEVDSDDGWEESNWDD
ncbi:MAG: Ycf66 family protein [Cyanobacteria bacterium J06607_13]